MVAHHIHDALAQVRHLRQLVLEKQAFRGYSGPARMLAGVVALCDAAVLDQLRPTSPWVHLLGWGCVLAAALALNYGALAWWFLYDPQCGRNPAALRPAQDALPAMATGAVLSLALVLHRQFDLLFGMWMMCYGLAHVPRRQVLPFPNFLLGLGYMVAGTACLLWPDLDFRNPWPMGIVFCVGEVTGGLIFFLDDRRISGKA